MDIIVEHYQNTHSVPQLRTARISLLPKMITYCDVSASAYIDNINPPCFQPEYDDVTRTGGIRNFTVSYHTSASQCDNNAFLLVLDGRDKHST